MSYKLTGVQITPKPDRSNCYEDQWFYTNMGLYTHWKQRVASGIDEWEELQPLTETEAEQINLCVVDEPVNPFWPLWAIGEEGMTLDQTGANTQNLSKKAWGNKK